jgi:hypothetical protein
MKRQSITPFLVGMGVGALVLMIVGFSANWVVTASAAQEEAERMAQKAMVEKLVPICVAQFEQDPNKAEDLQNLKAQSTWARGDFIEAQGWVTMPGNQSANEENLIRRAGIHALSGWLDNRGRMTDKISCTESH